MPPSAAVTAMTEAELSDCVVQTAHLFSWKVCLVRPARTAHGWRTPFGADGVGWPDLTMVRGNQLLFAELKSMKGKQTREQLEWMIALRAAHAEYHLWTPESWSSGEIEAVLRRLS